VGTMKSDESARGLDSHSTVAKSALYTMHYARYYTPSLVALNSNP
jgi:hypothetical protein